MNAGSFARLYERWVASGARDRSIEQELVHRTDDAWLDGDEADRFSVLSVIMRRRDLDRIDLLFEAMRTDTEFVAVHAASILSVFIGEGHEPPREVYDALDVFSTKFPERRILADSSLTLMDRDIRG